MKERCTPSSSKFLFRTRGELIWCVRGGETEGGLACGDFERQQGEIHGKQIVTCSLTEWVKILTLFSESSDKTDIHSRTSFHFSFFIIIQLRVFSVTSFIEFATKS